MLRQLVRLHWMSRKGWDYEQMLKFGSPAGSPISCLWASPLVAEGVRTAVEVMARDAR